MPLYKFTCDPCNITIDEWRPMSEAALPRHCEHCGQLMYRDFHLECGRQTSGDHVFQHPIEMYSCAPVEQHAIDALKRKLPDIKFNDLDVPVARNRAEKLRILKAVGHVETN